MKFSKKAWALVFVAAATILPAAHAQFTQSGFKLTGTGAVSPATQGYSVAISADGNTAIVGGPGDNTVTDVGITGAVWIFTRGSNGAWTQQGNKLVVSQASGLPGVGFSVALSGDGNTAIVGGPADNQLPDGSGSLGAAWIFTRTNNAWTQQSKLVGNGAAGASGQGFSVAISADGNTAIVGGPGDNPAPDNNIQQDTAGAAWIFTRNGNVWNQQGAKLVGPNANGGAAQGASVALSADGSTALIGGPYDSSQLGAAWVFTRGNSTWTPQGKLVGGGAVGEATQGVSVALSSDGNTAILGGPGDGTIDFVLGGTGMTPSNGAAWIFTRSGETWTQQGGKLFGANASNADQGISVRLSSDGNTAAVGGWIDSNNTGAVWLFARSGGAWTQLGNKLVGTGAGGSAVQSTSVALSGDGKTLLEGGPTDSSKAGAVWVFTAPPAAGPPTVSSLTPAVSGGASQTLTVTYNAPGGFQTLDVANLLINTALDGRQACYLAYSHSANTLYIVNDDGDPSQLTGKVTDGTGSIGNSQCTVTFAGSSATGSGDTFTLTLNLSFTASFAGNKVVYAAARDLSLNNSGWQTAGVHFVPGATATFPNPTGVAAPSPDAALQTITFTYQDQNTAANLRTVWALVNTAIDGRAACYVAYFLPGNLLYLYPDNGDGTKATNIVLAGSNTISNSQCTISAQGSSVQSSGNTLTLTLAISFTPAFAGFKGVWLAAQTGGNFVTSPWESLGALVIP